VRGVGTARSRVWQPVPVTTPLKDRVRHVASALALIGLLGVLAAGCGARVDPAEPPSLRVAVGPDAESRILARTIGLLLDDVGITAELIAFADGRSTRQAIELGDVDLAIAYSGEEWLSSLGRANPPADPVVGLEVLAEADRARGLTWLLPAVGPGGGFEEPPANATFAFFVAGPPAADADLRTLSELSLRLSEHPELSLCVDTEFGRRPDGLAALLSAYSVRRDRPFLAAGPAEAVLGVLAGDCVAGLSHATDGLAWRSGLQPLTDDLRFFPAFVPSPVVRTEVLSELPAIARALRPLLDGLSTGMLGRANGEVASGASVEVVATDLALRLRRMMADLP
jgi:osmoprotectant transport system substrate-binding protein